MDGQQRKEANMLRKSITLRRLALAAPLLSIAACYTGSPQQEAPEEAEDPVKLLNPLDEALNLNDIAVRPRFLAGQHALTVTAMPEERRSERLSETFVEVDPERVTAWQALEAQVETAVDDFWLDVAESPEFDTFRVQWLNCVEGDYASQPDVFTEIERLHEGGEHNEANALEAKADSCMSSLADSFNTTAQPIFEAWSNSNAKLLADYRSVVMEAAPAR